MHQTHTPSDTCPAQVYNGNQWYVDQTMGPGNAIENFYTNPATKDAYKTWVRQLRQPNHSRLQLICAFADLLHYRKRFSRLSTEAHQRYRWVAL